VSVGAFSVELYRQLIDTMTEALVVVDGEQRAMLANRAFCRICEVDEAEILGQPMFGTAMTVSAQDRLGRLLRDAAADGRTLDRVPLEACLPAGRRSFVLSARPLGADGNLCLLTFRDNAWAAQWANAAESIDNTNKQVVEINHRVKNNLSAVLAMLRLEGRNLTDGPAKEMLDRIAMRVRAIASLYELLAVERRPGRVELISYFRTLARSIELVAGRDKGSWTIEVSGTDVEVSVDDAVKYGAVVNELVANAVKYAFGPGGTGGRIDICCQRISDTVEISISDNGVGIAGSSNGNASSTGLGIRLVDLYLHALNGVMERSTVPGEGTTCVLRVPYRPPTAEESEPPPNIVAPLRAPGAPHFAEGGARGGAASASAAER